MYGVLLLVGMGGRGKVFTQRLVTSATVALKNASETPCGIKQRGAAEEPGCVCVQPSLMLLKTSRKSDMQRRKGVPPPGLVRHTTEK